MLVQNRKAPKSGLPDSGLAVFVGYPKSGKTTLAASFPDSYLFELEPGGADRVDGRIHDIGSMAEFRKVLPLAIADPKIRTIIVDTVDVVSDWLETEIAAEKGMESITDRKEGVNGYELWGTFKKRIENLASYFKRCGKLVILLAHTKEPKTDDNGKVIAPGGINVPGKGGAFIAAQADMIGFCQKKEVGSGLIYTISFRGGPLGQWGSRIDEVNGKTITLSKANPYRDFADAFKGKATNGNGKAPALKDKAQARPAGKKTATKATKRRKTAWPK